ncbi:MAG TPA: ABC transporter permease [Gemmataceae bacterium]|nr:ABC transporter permease [Gemmataceae bacterium]
MSFALATLWHERSRFLPGILVVAFSALLIAVQGGLLLGIFSLFALPIDRSRADVWVGYPGTPSVDLCLPIPKAWEARLAVQPEVARVETYLYGTIAWGKRGGGIETCSVIGSSLDDESLGAITELTPELRARLKESGSVVVDESALIDLGLTGLGDVAEVAGHRVRVVGVVHGIRGIAGAYIFCSLPTAQTLLRMRPDQAVFLLAGCRNPADVPTVLERLRTYENMSAFSRDEFSLRSRLHWLFKTKAGVALGCAALLGLIVGAAVTSQTLSAATAASLRELAVLEALGIPTWRMQALVLAQSFWVGLLGVALAVPASFCSAGVLQVLGARIVLPAWMLGGAAGLTMAMALLAGLVSLRALRRVEPATLLR